MLDLLLKASIVLTILFVFYKVVLEKESFFAKNRIFLIGSLGLVFVLPFITLPQLIEEQGMVSTAIEKITQPEKEAFQKGQSESPAIRLSIPYDLPIDRSTKLPVTINNSESTRSVTTSEPLVHVETNNDVFSGNEPKPIPRELKDWLLIGYLFGVFIFSLHLLTQLMSVALRIFNTSDKIKDSDYTLVNMSEEKEPCSFFNYIFINPELYDFATYEQILRHESIHVKKRHSIDLIIAELAIILLWFNPLIWLYRREVEKNIEYQTDELLVDGEPTQKENYQMNLLRIATYNRPLTVTTNYNQSLLKQRILRMNTKKSNPHSFWKYAFVLPLLFVLLLSLNRPETSFAQSPENTDFASIGISPDSIHFEEIVPIDTTESNIKSVATKSVTANSETIKLNPVESEETNLEEPIIKQSVIVEEPKGDVAEPELSDCEALEKAIISGDYERVELILRTIDENCNLFVDQPGSANSEMIKNRLLRYADEVQFYNIDDERNLNDTPECEELERAAKNKDYNKVRELLQRNLDCLTNGSGAPLLSHILRKGMLRNGANLDIDVNGHIRISGTAEVISWGDDEMYQDDDSDCDGILRAARKGDVAMIRKLLLTTATDCFLDENGTINDMLYIRSLLNNGAHIELGDEDEVIIYGVAVNINFDDEDDDQDLEDLGLHRLKGADSEMNDCKKLLLAVKDVDVSRIAELLERADPNCAQNDTYQTNEKGRRSLITGYQTPLVYAARNGNIEIGRLLLDAGADPEFHVYEEETPLLAAVDYGHFEFVKLLVEQGADVNKQTTKHSALFMAKEDGDQRMIDYLISKGANEFIARYNRDDYLEITSIENGSIKNAHAPSIENLIREVRSQNTNKVRTLLIEADVNGFYRSVDSEGEEDDVKKPIIIRSPRSALVAAARIGDVEMGELLIANGANIEYRPEGDESPLMAAADKGNLAFVKMLVEKGADVNKFHKGDGEPVAIFYNAKSSIQSYMGDLFQKINYEKRVPGQGTALSAAERTGQNKVVKYLKSQGANR